MESNRIFFINKKQLQYVIPNFILSQEQPDRTIKKRFLLDFSYLEFAFATTSFKLTSAEKVASFMENRFCIALDLKKCFFQIKLRHPNRFGFRQETPSPTRKYILGYRWQHSDGKTRHSYVFYYSINT